MAACTPLSTNSQCATMPARDKRVCALRRFGSAITILTILGHSFLGFEAALGMVFVALATTYSVDFLLETIDARAHRRRAQYRGGVRAMIDFFLPAHISGLAIAMLTFSGAHFLPIVLAGAVAMASKWIFRAPVGRGMRHFLNPSNTGIAFVLVVFPWVGIAPPYQFTENVAGGWDWFFPSLIILSGSVLNACLTGRIPLILSWLGGFAAQALVRAALSEVSPIPALAPMTGMAFLLYTFYMISDPATTPMRRAPQVFFGLTVAAVYGVFTEFGGVFGLFFALFAVCATRGVGLWVLAFARSRAEARAVLPSPAAFGSATASPQVALEPFTMKGRAT
ncbi:MAG: enediyne biosynthesis protein UnbU [Planctomycetota bacterium]